MNRTMPGDRRRGVALVAVVVIAAAVVMAAVGAAVVAFAVTGGPAPAASEAASSDAPKPQEAATFVSFGDTVANLAEERLTRYVKVSITLQVSPDQADKVQEVIGGPKKAIFSNWLITYLSDKQLQDVKGANAMNRLRREIQDGFNAILAEEGGGKIDRVLFEEFNVQ